MRLDVYIMPTKWNKSSIPTVSGECKLYTIKEVRSGFVLDLNSNENLSVLQLFFKGNSKDIGLSILPVLHGAPQGALVIWFYLSLSDNTNLLWLLLSNDGTSAVLEETMEEMLL